MSKIFLISAILLSLIIVGCQPIATTPGPDNTQERSSPQSISPIPTETPTITPLTTTPTRLPPTPTFTPTQTDTPTATPSPTPDIPDYYHGLAPTLDQFTELASKDDIPKIITDLRSQPSLLTDSADPIPIFVGEVVNNGLNVVCNEGEINCAVAASVKVFDQGQWRWLYIVEMRNNDDTRSRGYLTGYFYDEGEFPAVNPYRRLVENPSQPVLFLIVTSLTAHESTILPYMKYIIDQPGTQDLLEQLLETQVIPPALENIIIPVVTG